MTKYAHSTDYLRVAAAEVGFILDPSADGDSGMLRRPDRAEPYYVGTNEEIRAYLAAWDECATMAGLGRPSSGQTYDQAMLAFSSGPYDVQPGAQVGIYVTPHAAPFQGTRLAIPEEIAGLFELIDLKVGNHSQLDCSSPIPCQLFSTRSSRGSIFELVGEQGPGVRRVVMTSGATAEFGCRVKMWPCLIAQHIEIVARLLEGSPPTKFCAVLMGRNILSY